MERDVGVVRSQKGRSKKDPGRCLRERPEAMQGQWQQEAPFREILEQVRSNADMGQMMRRGYHAMRNGSWEEFKERYRKVIRMDSRE